MLFELCRTKRHGKCYNSVAFARVTKRHAPTIAENVTDASAKWITIVHG